MLGVLIKKQLMEVFRAYFYDAKKNKKRSRGRTIAMFILFGVLLIGILGGMFTFLSIGLCPGLAAAEMGWLYFTILAGIAIIFGAFGSVFNTFSGLYLGKDNDLLLSMPIPVRSIIFSRLLNVYLLGTMYSSVVIVPAVVVYWVLGELSVLSVIGGIVLWLLVTLIVMILSCLLGWVVAKISLKLKNKSIITVLISLTIIVLYYIFYFKANELINDLIANAAVYGMKIKGSAYILYMFGKIGEGDIRSMLIYVAAIGILLYLTWLVLSKSFLSIATTKVNSKTKSKAKITKEKGVFSALLSKEFSRFLSSATYMLNCALGVVLIPAAGIGILIKGGELFNVMSAVFADKPECVYIIFCGILCMIGSMIDTAAPSVSLEGRSIWIVQSLPVDSKYVLRAKVTMQLILSSVPMLFSIICAQIICPCGLSERIFITVIPLMFTVFMAVANVFLNMKLPDLSWTNELIPIKQGASVAISIFGSWGVALLFAVPYFFIGYKIGFTAYMSLWTVIFAVAAYVIYHWLDTKGAKAFSQL